MLEVFNRDIATDFTSNKIEAFKDEQALSKEYDRGRFYSNRTNLIGPNPSTGTYQFAWINPEYENLIKNNHKIFFSILKNINNQVEKTDEELLNEQINSVDNLVKGITL